MSIQQLIDRSHEIRAAIDAAPTLDECVYEKYLLIGYLEAVHQVFDLIGADAAMEIMRGKKTEAA